MKQTIKSQGNKHNVTALINVEKVTASNVKIDFRGQSAKDSSVTQNQTITISVNQYIDQNVSVLWDLNKTDFISITVDFSNVVAETDETNNYVKKTARPLTKAYVDVATDYPVVIDAVKNYLSQYIDVVSSGQDVNIYVGRKNSNIPKDIQTLGKENTRWGLINNIVNFNAKSEGLPYNGIAVKSGTNIYVFGNEIDGELAALRKIVDNQEFYFSKSVPERIDYISEEDLNGLFVFDYLHTDENQPSYRKNSANFGKVVENVLNSNVYSLAIKRVLTYNDNTSLRIKHVNAELGPKYKNFSNAKPVVLASGIFNDLFTWEEFGFEIARGVDTNKPRDTWLIEIIGGPNTECKTCPNYKYGDLINSYWPALISGVEAYSNQHKLDYVGFSTGCIVALDSLKNWSSGKLNASYYNNGSDWILTNLSANVVDNFVGVACPGRFKGDYLFKRLMNNSGDLALNELELKENKTHISRKEFVSKLCQKTNRLSPDWPSCIVINWVMEDAEANASLNLVRDYVKFATADGAQPGSGLNLNKFSIIQGYSLLSKLNTSESTDFIVSTIDEREIYAGINSQDKKRLQVAVVHHGNVDDNPTTKRLIKKMLNNESLSFFERTLNLVEQNT